MALWPCEFAFSRIKPINQNNCYCRSLKATTGEETKAARIPDHCCVCDRRLGILNIGHSNQSCESCSKNVCRQCIRGNLCKYCSVLR